MIHHTIKKRLEAAGVVIEEPDNGSDYRFRAFWESQKSAGVDHHSVELWGNDAKELGAAMLAAKMLMVEHRVAIEQDMETGAVEITVGIKNPRVVGRVEDVADLEDAIPDILEALTSEEAEEIVEADAEDAEEEDKRGGSVVPDVFKKRYAEAGHPGTCGDWLANILKENTTLQSGKLDVDATSEIARLNGVDVSRLNTTSPGWQGRYRMTARNMMVKKVAAAGFLLLPSEEGDPIRVGAPAEWVAVNKPKVKEAGDKKAARATKGA